MAEYALLCGPGYHCFPNAGPGAYCQCGETTWDDPPMLFAPTIDEKVANLEQRVRRLEELAELEAADG